MIADEDTLPWINHWAIYWLSSMIRETDRVFEWGSGASTIWFAKKVSSVISIESDPNWFREISTQISEEGLTNVDLKFIGKDPIGTWRAYSNEIKKHPQNSFDLIFVDGDLATRTICAEAAIRVAGEDTIIILDNSIRKHEAAKVLEAWASEYVTFYCCGRRGQKWGTSFYYGKHQSGEIRC